MRIHLDEGVRPQPIAMISARGAPSIVPAPRAILAYLLICFSCAAGLHEILVQQHTPGKQHQRMDHAFDRQLATLQARLERLQQQIELLNRNATRQIAVLRDQIDALREQAESQGAHTEERPARQAAS
jgi:hypothetical protein